MYPEKFSHWEIRHLWHMKYLTAFQILFSLFWKHEDNTVTNEKFQHTFSQLQMNICREKKCPYSHWIQSHIHWSQHECDSWSGLQYLKCILSIPFMIFVCLLDVFTYETLEDFLTNQNVTRWTVRNNPKEADQTAPCIFSKAYLYFWIPVLPLVDSICVARCGPAWGMRGLKRKLYFKLCMLKSWTVRAQ